HGARRASCDDAAEGAEHRPAPDETLRRALRSVEFTLPRPHYRRPTDDWPVPGARLEQIHGTTILSVRRGNRVVIGGDGQVSMGNTVMKANARKVRRLYKDRVLAGFAGATADAFTLFERFEAELDKYQGHLTRAAVELAKHWRTDRALRRLEALLAVA